MREGWKTASIEDVAQLVNGGTPKTSVPEYWDGQHLWITPAEMGRLDSPYIATSRRKLTAAGLQNSSSCLVPKNSVILSTRAPIGHLVINDAPMAFNQGCRGLIPRQQVHYKYLYYFLFSSVDLLNDLGSGTTFKELAAGKLKKVELPVPPFPEQKRIVAILDEAFAGIATAVANTEKNLANARELFESYLNAVLSERRDGWIEKPLGECFRLKSGDGLTNSKMVPGDFSVFGGNGIAGTHNQNNLAGENVIIGRVGALCGNARYINEPIWLTDNAFKVVDKQHAIDDRFLVYLLNFKNLRRYARQSAQPVISNSSLRNVELRFPESEFEQRRLVVRLDELNGDIGRLSSVYQQKRTALAELKQALLQKAFAGELSAAPQDEIETALA